MSGGVEAGEVGRRMREVLTLGTVVRAELARRLAMSVHDVEAVEMVMTAQALGGEQAALLGPAELARRLGVSSAAATQSLHRLEQAGHVVRRPHPQDRRRQVVEVTDSGRAHVLQALLPLLALLRASEERLTPQESQAVLTYLDGQAAAYRAFLGGPEPPA